MPLVLGYHRVVTDFDSAAQASIEPNLISVETLKHQLEYFAQDYTFVSLDELVASLYQGSREGNKLAAVTFDDGYADVYHNAYPLLRDMNIPFTVFVVSNLIGTDQLLPHDHLYLLVSEAINTSRVDVFRAIGELQDATCQIAKELENELYASSDAFDATRRILDSLNLEGIKTLINRMESRLCLPEDRKQAFRGLSPDMLSEMLGAGVTVGSHTVSHAVLANETADNVRAEVVRSKHYLQNCLNTEIKHFAYPDGSFNALVIAEVARAGYTSAVTTCTHQDRARPELTIPRHLLWEKSSINGFNNLSTAVLSCQANGIFDPATKCSRMHFA
nr:polysaccharide deacetylase family protein [Litorivivens lipolytica]